ncbi:MAG: bacteriohemerythrin [Motiliproteus sp.]
MSLFVFDDSLKLGIKALDEQHSRFIGYINDTWDALDQGKPQDEFLYILNRLLDYAMEHLSAEEALMQEHDYPDYAAHKALHNETAADLFEFDLRLLAGDPEESRAFLQFLTDWLNNHIRVTDRALAAFLKHKGVS